MVKLMYYWHQTCHIHSYTLGLFKLAMENGLPSIIYMTLWYINIDRRRGLEVVNDMLTIENHHS